MTEGEQPAAEPQIMIDPAQMAGVWSNFARVSHSPYEFTLDFARLDFAVNPPQGIVVARVSLSPLMVTQLIEALSINWARYAEKSMPPEVQRHAETPDDGSRGEPCADDAPA
ncbi:MAG TPA: DUF3467 domain-containing protein [Streptosporangiaceae bacterium]|nr:DUF3467 domain-containing protein [Streptosporangiaceae bacterium]